MRKFLTMMVVALLSIGVVSAQTRKIWGKVTDSKGAPVPGATVKTKNGTAVAADENGNYTIEAQTGDVLTITSIDFGTATAKVGNGASLNIELVNKENKLEEVVVTAQGVRKRPKELGYSVAKVTTAELTNGRSPQLAAGLSGKVSGLAVFNVNNSVDPSVKISLRGYRSLTGNNDALIVIDGLPLPKESSTMLNLLNPNDIESISVLKGGVAATLYGSDGVNGALVITTKKGVKGKARITYTHSSNIDKINNLTKFQDKYGSGSHYAAGFGTAGWKPNYLDRMKDNWRTYENQQFGDEFDGSQRLAGRVLEDGSSLILPYSAIEGERSRIWNTGSTMNNQASVSGGTDQSTFYLSIENNRIDGIVPGDKATRTGTRFSATTETGRLKVGFNAAYIQADYDRSTFDFYNETINQAANIPLSTMRDWRNNKFANPNAWYNDYFTNPYFRLDNERSKYQDANITGTMDLTFKINNWLNFYNKVSVLTNTRQAKNTVGKFIHSEWAKFDAYLPVGIDQGDGEGITRAGTDFLGSVSDASGQENVLNNEAQLQGNHDFGDWNVKGLVGFSLYDRRTKGVNIASNSIVVPDVYNVQNRTGNLEGGESNTRYRKYGYYGEIQFGWKDMLFLHGVGRYDATSKFFKPTRETGDYSYFYPGVDVSAVLTEMLPSLRGNVINYAKLRVGYNKNGNDNVGTNVIYGLDPTFPSAPGFPYGNTVGISVGDALPDANLKPEFVTSFEAGAEIALFQNRINLDVTYYSQISKGQVVSVRIPNTTGYSFLSINVGETTNSGIETDLKLQLIKSPKFSWDLNVRYAYNTNKVVKLYNGVPEFVQAGFSYASAYIIEGQSFPVMKAISNVRDPQGRIVVNKTTGYPLTTGPLKNFGRTTPPHILGAGTSFNLGNFNLTANFEYRGGHVFYSDLGRQMTFTGSGQWTENRAPFIVPNSSYDDGTGTGKYVANDKPTNEAEYAYWVDSYRLIAENFVVPAWFIKMRDVNLSYQVPASFVSKTKIFAGASIGLYGRNLFTIVDSKNLFTDPEFSFTNGNGLGVSTTAQTPPVRQYGFTLSFNFK